MLGETFKYPINPQVIPDTTELYVHGSNKDLAPDWRPFYLWKCEPGSFSFTDEELLRWKVETAIEAPKLRSVSDSPVMVVRVKPRKAESCVSEVGESLSAEPRDARHEALAEYLRWTSRDGPVSWVSAPTGW